MGGPPAPGLYERLFYYTEQVCNVLLDEWEAQVPYLRPARQTIRNNVERDLLELVAEGRFPRSEAELRGFLRLRFGYWLGQVVLKFEQQGFRARAVLGSNGASLIMELTPEQQSVLILRVFAEFGVNRVAQLLGQDVKWVKQVRAEAFDGLRRLASEVK